MSQGIRSMVYKQQAVRHSLFYFQCHIVFLNIWPISSFIRKQNKHCNGHFFILFSVRCLSATLNPVPQNSCFTQIPVWKYLWPWNLSPSTLWDAVRIDVWFMVTREWLPFHSLRVRRALLTLCILEDKSAIFLCKQVWPETLLSNPFVCFVYALPCALLWVERNIYPGIWMPW